MRVSVPAIVDQILEYLDANDYRIVRQEQVGFVTTEPVNFAGMEWAEDLRDGVMWSPAWVDLT